MVIEQQWGTLETLNYLPCFIWTLLISIFPCDLSVSLYIFLFLTTDIKCITSENFIIHCMEYLWPWSSFKYLCCILTFHLAITNNWIYCLSVEVLCFQYCSIICQFLTFLSHVSAFQVWIFSCKDCPIYIARKYSPMKLAQFYNLYYSYYNILFYTFVNAYASIQLSNMENRLKQQVTPEMRFLSAGERSYWIGNF